MTRYSYTMHARLDNVTPSPFVVSGPDCLVFDILDPSRTHWSER